MSDDIVYLVIVWSLCCPSMVTGQCTSVDCNGVEYRSNVERNLNAFDVDGDVDYRSQLEELKLQVQLLTEELGTLWSCNNVYRMQCCSVYIW